MIDFDPRATNGFSLVNAYFLAQASKLAYLDDNVQWLAAQELGLTGLRTFADTDSDAPDWGVRCFVAKRDEATILAFRGTASIAGWMTDADIKQVGDVDGAVHEGFHDGLQAVWPGLIAHLLLTSGPLWITGHSLGGALATLAARWLDARGYNIAAVYTLGSPRVGNREFAAKYHPRTFRLVNNDDIVPHVPLPLTLAGLRVCTYKHVGALEYFDRHGQLAGGTANWETKKAQVLDGLKDATLGQLRLGRNLTDHYIDNYVAAIASNFTAKGAAA